MKSPSCPRSLGQRGCFYGFSSSRSQESASACPGGRLGQKGCFYCGMCSRQKRLSGHILINPRTATLRGPSQMTSAITALASRPASELAKWFNLACFVSFEVTFLTKVGPIVTRAQTMIRTASPRVVPELHPTKRLYITSATREMRISNGLNDFQRLVITEPIPWKTALRMAEIPRIQLAFSEKAAVQWVPTFCATAKRSTPPRSILKESPKKSLISLIFSEISLSFFANSLSFSGNSLREVRRLFFFLISCVCDSSS